MVGGLVGGVVGAGALLGACDSAPPTTPTSTPTGSSRPPSSAASSAATTSASPTATTPTAAATPAVLSTPGPDIASGPSTTAAVALTFHGAGDVALAHQVLSLLQQRGAKVTVFAVGTWLAATPSIGRDIVSEGHALGNHTWSHPTLTHLGLAAATDEVKRGADAVAASVGHAGLLFRPSGTPTSTATIRAAAASAGYARSISYDLDSLDYTDPGADAVVRTVTAGLHRRLDRQPAPRPPGDAERPAPHPRRAAVEEPHRRHRPDPPGGPRVTRPTRPRAALLAAASALALGLLGACSSGSSPSSGTTPAPGGSGTSRTAGGPGPSSTTSGTSTASATDAADASTDVYAAVGAGMLTGHARTARPLVYVPDQVAGRVQVIDPSTYQVVATFRVASSPEHVVPSHDLTTLWVNSDAGDSPDPDRPADGQARHPGARLRPLQPLLHARRAVRARHERAARRHRGPRRAHDGAVRDVNCRCRARASTTRTSPPTAPPCSPAASSAASSSRSTRV